MSKKSFKHNLSKLSDYEENNATFVLFKLAFISSKKMAETYRSKLKVHTSLDTIDNTLYNKVLGAITTDLAVSLLEKIDTGHTSNIKDVFSSNKNYCNYTKLHPNIKNTIETKIAKYISNNPSTEIPINSKEQKAPINSAETPAAAQNPADNNNPPTARDAKSNNPEAFTSNTQQQLIESQHREQELSQLLENAYQNNIDLQSELAAKERLAEQNRDPYSGALRQTHQKKGGSENLSALAQSQQESYRLQAANTALGKQNQQLTTRILDLESRDLLSSGGNRAFKAAIDNSDLVAQAGKREEESKRKIEEQNTTIKQLQSENLQQNVKEENTKKILQQRSDEINRLTQLSEELLYAQNQPQTNTKNNLITQFDEVSEVAQLAKKVEYQSSLIQKHEEFDSQQKVIRSALETKIKNLESTVKEEPSGSKLAGLQKRTQQELTQSKQEIRNLQNALKDANEGTALLYDRKTQVGHLNNEAIEERANEISRKETLQLQQDFNIAQEALEAQVTKLTKEVQRKADPKNRDLEETAKLNTIISSLKIEKTKLEDVVVYQQKYIESTRKNLSGDQNQTTQALTTQLQELQDQALAAGASRTEAVEEAKREAALAAAEKEDTHKTQVTTLTEEVRSKDEKIATLIRSQSDIVQGLNEQLAQLRENITSNATDAELATTTALQQAEAQAALALAESKQETADLQEAKDAEENALNERLTTLTEEVRSKEEQIVTLGGSQDTIVQRLNEQLAQLRENITSNATDAELATTTALQQAEAQAALALAESKKETADLQEAKEAEENTLKQRITTLADEVERKEAQIETLGGEQSNVVQGLNSQLNELRNKAVAEAEAAQLATTTALQQAEAQAALALAESKQETADLQEAKDAEENALNERLTTLTEEVRSKEEQIVTLGGSQDTIVQRLNDQLDELRNKAVTDAETAQLFSTTALQEAEALAALQLEAANKRTSDLQEAKDAEENALNERLTTLTEEVRSKEAQIETLTGDNTQKADNLKSQLLQAQKEAREAREAQTAKEQQDIALQERVKALEKEKADHALQDATDTAALQPNSEMADFLKNSAKAAELIYHSLGRSAKGAVNDANKESGKTLNEYFDEQRNEIINNNTNVIETKLKEDDVTLDKFDGNERLIILALSDNANFNHYVNNNINAQLKKTFSVDVKDDKLTMLNESIAVLKKLVLEKGSLNPNLQTPSNSTDAKSALQTAHTINNQQH